MNKFILSIVISIIIGVGGILFLARLNTNNSTLNFQDIAFFPLVKGCAETDMGMATKSFGEAIEQEPSIEVIGDQIVYSRALNHMCCRKADIEKEIKGSTINIYEIWSGAGCKCTCFSEIEAKLENVPSGAYTVNVYEKGVKSGDVNDPMEEKVIISGEITI